MRIVKRMGIAGVTRVAHAAHAVAAYVARTFTTWSVSQCRGVLFIVGFNNSGKTTLTRLLSADPTVCAYPDEGNADLWFCGAYPWVSSCAPRGPIWYEPEEFIAYVCGQRSDGFQGAAARLGAWRFVCGCNKALNDSGMLAGLLPHVIGLFPDARIVHFLRDGRVVSYLAARTEWVRMMRAPERFLTRGCSFQFEDVLARMARYWAWMISEMDRVSVMCGGRCVEVRYEEWCCSPTVVAERVQMHFGIDVQRLAEVDAVRNMNELVLSNISAREMAIIEEHAGDALRAKGYLVERDRNPACVEGA